MISDLMPQKSSIFLPHSSVCMQGMHIFDLLKRKFDKEEKRPALSAEPPFVKTNSEPLLPFPSRNVGVRYVVVRITDDLGPMGRLMSLPKVNLGGWNDTCKAKSPGNLTIKSLT